VIVSLFIAPHFWLPLTQMANYQGELQLFLMSDESMSGAVDYNFGPGFSATGSDP